MQMGRSEQWQGAVGSKLAQELVERTEGRSRFAAAA